MKKEEFNFLSSNGKTLINCVKWVPDKPKGIIQIVHGITEHIGRYDEFASYMTNLGYIVVGNDHLGHGKSIIKDKPKMFIGELGSWKNLVEDINKVYDLIKDEYDELPIYLIGFSLGSFVSRNYLIDYNPNYEKVILVGTGIHPEFILNILKKVVLKEVNKIGIENTSEFIRNLSFGTYNKQIKNPNTDYDWLTSSQEEINKYINDSFIEKNTSGSLFYELINGMVYTSKINNIKKMSKDIPILLLSGADDPVGIKGKGVNKLYKIYKKNGLNVSIKLYDGKRHDLFHETNKLEVFKDIEEYIKKELN